MGRAAPHRPFWGRTEAAPWRYHEPQQPRIAPGDAVSLIDTIEADLKHVGTEVSDEVHQVLAKHLTVTNLALHVADGISNPVFADLEALAGLPPQVQSVVAKVAKAAAGELTAILDESAQPVT